MAQSPGGLRLGGVKSSERWTTEAFGPDGIFRREDAFEDSRLNHLPQNVIPQPDISCTQENIATPVMGVG
jgi:hypothetical protein